MKQQENTALPGRILVIFLLLIVCISISGYLYYKNLKRQLQEEIQEHLAAVADLKTQQIVNWRKELLADARVVIESPALAPYVRQVLDGRAPEKMKRELASWLTLWAEQHEHASIALVDARGSVRLTTKPADALGEKGKRHLAAAIRTGDVYITDFHFGRSMRHSHIDLVVPVRSQAGDRAPSAAFFLRVDPRRFLFPLLQSWPTKSRTAETMLAERDGDDVLFLNDLRHKNNSAFQFRLPVATEKLPAAMAVRGVTGVVEGVDYRGVPVLAAIRAVPGTSWFMIAKVDQEEIYAPLRLRAWLIAALTIALIAAAGLGVGYWWRQQSATFYRRHYEAEAEFHAERKKMESQALARLEFLQILIEAIPIPVYYKDVRGVYQGCNTAFAQSLGRPKEAILGKTVYDIAPKDLADTYQIMDSDLFQRGGTQRYETFMPHADGTRHDVIIHKATFADENGSAAGLVGVITDVTQEKRLERERSAEAAALLEGTRAVLKYREFPDAARDIFDACRNLLGATAGYVAMLSSDGSKNELLFLEAGGRPCAVDRSLPMPVRGLRERAYSLRKTVWENDFPQSEWAKLMPQGHVTLDNVLFAPLIIEGGAVGVIGLANKPGGFTERDAHLAAAFGELAAVALRNSRTLETLEAGEERLQQVLKGSRQGFWDWNIATGEVVRNERWAEMLGYTLREIERDVRQWTDLIHPADQAAAWQSIQDHLDGRTAAHEIEYRMRAKDGQYKWILDRATVVQRDSQGKPLRMSGTHTDVTERRQTQEQLTLKSYLLDNASDSIFVSDLGNEIVYANDTAGTTRGYSREEMAGMKVSRLNAPEYALLLPGRIANLIAQGTGTYESVHVRKDGSAFPVEVHARVIEREGSKFVHALVRDITERKRAELALKESEERYRRLVEGSPDIVYRFSSRQGGVYYSARVKAILGYTPAYLFDHPFIWHDSIHPDDLAGVDHAIGNADKTTGYQLEYRIKDAGGNWHWFQDRFIGKIVKDDEIIIEGLATDITERKRSEEELHFASQRLQIAMQSAKLGIWDWDIVNNLMTWDDRMLELYGHSRESFRGGVEAWERGLHPEDRDRAWDECQQALRGEKPFDTEFRVLHPDGTVLHLKADGLVLRDADGKPLRMLGINYDITERKAAEDALKRAKERSQRYLDIAGVMIVALDEKQNVVLVNRKGCEILGCCEINIIGKNWFDRFTPDRFRNELKGVFAQLMAGVVVPVAYYENPVRTAGGEERLIAWHNTVLRDDAGNIVGTLSSGEDITERRKLEKDALTKNYHLVQLGQLSAGIAHEINNPNNAILSSSQMLQNAWEDAGKILAKYYAENGDFRLGGLSYAAAHTNVAELPSLITSCSRRIREIIESLKDYAGRRRMSMDAEVNVNKVIADALIILGSQIRRFTDNYSADLKGNLPPVLGNRQALEQVVINLVMNALESLPDRGRGIRITSSFDEAQQSVVIQIADEGVGMSPEICREALDPFFTTKHDAGGTGLGLSISNAIITNHGGSLEFRSEPCKGTTAIVKLPAGAGERSGGDETV
ncbi:MAG: PAS domain S-box protein [Nitrospirota bacterium]|nr:PAS domain S-box protein [Nitrospirota bacterium]